MTQTPRSPTKRNTVSRKRTPAEPAIETPTGLGSPAPAKRRAIPWAEIQSTYEQSVMPVSVIAKAYALRERSIYERAARDGWSTRRTQGNASGPDRALDRSVLVSRLFHAVERQIAEIERRFIDVGGLSNGADERDARTLAALARTIELLIGLERQSKPGATDAPEADIDEFRRDLARRITNLQRSEPD